MSGSDRGRGGGGGGVDGPIACERLQFETEVRSQNQALLALVQVGEVLGVQLRAGPPISVVIVRGGQDLGGIVSPKATRLRECITMGTKYSATVISVNGGVVKVRIAPIP